MQRVCGPETVRIEAGREANDGQGGISHAGEATNRIPKRRNSVVVRSHSPRRKPYWEGEGSLGSRSPAFSAVRLPLVGSGARVEVSCPKLKFIIDRGRRLIEDAEAQRIAEKDQEIGSQSSPGHGFCGFLCGQGACLYWVERSVDGD